MNCKCDEKTFSMDQYTCTGQISIFDIIRPSIKITKPIRLIELFAGIGSQAMALKRLGANFEHYRVVEFEKYSELGRMLYITDTELIKWKFNNINHILLGVNYDKDLLDNENQIKRNHVYRGHLSIDTACEFVKCNSDSLETVIMCHLSDSNSDVDSFISKMKNVVPGANVCVAERGLEVELRKKGECPF